MSDKSEDDQRIEPLPTYKYKKTTDHVHDVTNTDTHLYNKSNQCNIKQ